MGIDLLCHEAWLSSPSTPTQNCHERDSEINSEHCLFSDRAEDSELTFKMFLEMQSSFMPEHGYFEYIYSNNDFRFFRFRTLSWLVKTCNRLNLSVGTIFYAANYFDRFMSKNQLCHDWKYWMIELPSVACLSIASKFNDTLIPSLSDLQMEGLEHSFQSSAIAKMELIVLQGLEWRLCSITTYSLLQTMTSNIKSHLLKEDLANRLNHLLLTSLLDLGLLEYPPSIVAISALWCGLEELFPSSSGAHLTYFTRFFDQKQMDEMIKCHEVMKARSFGVFDSMNCVDNG